MKQTLALALAFSLVATPVLAADNGKPEGSTATELIQQQEEAHEIKTGKGDLYCNRQGQLDVPMQTGMSWVEYMVAEWGGVWIDIYRAVKLGK